MVDPRPKDMYLQLRLYVLRAKSLVTVHSNGKVDFS